MEGRRDRSAAVRLGRLAPREETCMAHSNRASPTIAALLRSAEAGKQLTRARIERGKAEALRLIKENEGVDPANGGRLSQAEVYRLGGVDPTILGGKVHRETTRVELNSWLQQMARIAKLWFGRHYTKRSWIPSQSSNLSLRKRGRSWPHARPSWS